MKIVPASLEEQINRVDRQRALYIGIANAVVALWCLYRVFWGLYVGLTFGWLFGPMVTSVLLWGVVGVVAGITAFGFLTRYHKES
jgi:hypothetical protein